MRQQKELSKCMYIRVDIDTNQYSWVRNKITSKNSNKFRGRVITELKDYESESHVCEFYCVCNPQMLVLSLLGVL